MLNVIKKAATTAATTATATAVAAAGKLKGYLPPSSRSFHATARVVQQIFDEQQAMRAELTKRTGEAASRAAHASMYLEQMYRRDGETPEEARKRMFATIPPATGMFRTSQLANARMLSDLDAICAELGIDYWFSSGTLVATLYRAGFMPWDDDVDVCMMRDDIDKLAAYLRDNSDRYKVSVVYDRFVLTKQVRFVSTIPNLPCFVDLAIWDYARDASKEHDDMMHQLRREFMAEAGRIGGYWEQEPWVFAPDSAYCVQAGPVDYENQDRSKAAQVAREFESLVSKYQQKARDAGILCSKEEAGALMYTVDDFYNAPWRRFIWAKEDIFPLKRMPYESYQFPVPNEAEKVAEDCYPGCPYLPGDVIGSGHFQHEILEKQLVCDALRAYTA